MWAVFLVLFLPLFALPLLVVLGASFAAHWSSVLPSGFTTANYRAATRGEALQALTTSLVTALTASLLALAVGTWAALAAAALKKRYRRVMDALFVLPVAVPSVVVGLAVLVAYSQPPFLLNGTRWIVIVAHTVLVTALDR
ncbi:ABC transporter permease, partial [Streptomyces sp. SID5910]|nr:ABC transporter permease [Streptomyces sp. SID5910]